MEMKRYKTVRFFALGGDSDGLLSFLKSCNRKKQTKELNNTEKNNEKSAYCFYSNQWDIDMHLSGLDFVLVENESDT